MSDASVRQLEREVEAARAKLASDLSTLRSPDTFSEFSDGLKQEALDAKDALVEKATSKARSTLDDIVENLKARAAANPAAVLAIGAGVAWRLVRHPPIATALIGAGIYNLWRTTPTPSHGYGQEPDYLVIGKDRLREQASDLVDTVKDHAIQAAAAVKDHAMDTAGTVRDRAVEAAATVRDQALQAAGAARSQAADLGDIARRKMHDWGDEAKSTAQALTSELKDQAASYSRQASDVVADMRQTGSDIGGRVTGRATMMAEQASTRLQGAINDRETPDKLLLGAAAIAVAAALGMAYQRRSHELAGVD